MQLTRHFYIKTSVLLILIGVLAVIALAYGLAAYLLPAARDADSDATARAAEAALHATPSSAIPVFATTTDAIVVHEFDSFDPSCADCASMHAAVQAQVASLPQGVGYRFHAYPIAHPLSTAASTTPFYDARDILGYCIASTTGAQGDSVILAYAAAAYADPAAATGTLLADIVPVADQAMVQACVTAMPADYGPITDAIAGYENDKVMSAPALFLQVRGIPDPVPVMSTAENIPNVLRAISANPSSLISSLKAEYAK